jgi:type IV secretory pathway VirB6-like protein
MPARRTSAHRPRSVAEHRAIQPSRWFAARQAAIQRAEFATVVVEQALEVVAGFARRTHVENLARIRASA